LVLAVGTTAGVVAMTAVAVTALRRSGMRLRPRWEPSHPEVARLRRAGAWAAGFLALNQLLVATTMVLANRVEGGVVAFQIAFTFFLVPHALLAHPVLTALYPRLAAEGHGRRWAELAGGVTRGAGTIAFGVLPAAALLVALGRPALHLIQGGALSGAGAGLVSKLLAAYALGLMGYAGLHLLTRASYAAGDTRTPTMVNLGIAGGGAALMIAWSSVARGDDKVVVLGLAHSVVMIAGAIVLWLLLQRRLGHGIHIGASLVRGATCAAAAGLVARVVVDSFGAGSRLGTLVELSLASVAGVGFYLVAQWALRAPELNRFKQRGGHLGPVGPTP